MENLFKYLNYLSVSSYAQSVLASAMLTWTMSQDTKTLNC